MRRTCLILFFFLTASISRAEVQLLVKPESKVWLEGDSTLHHFSSTATQFQTHARLNPSAPAGPKLLDAIQNHHLEAFEFSIPAAGLKSGKSGLDKNMMAALKAVKYPVITFRMTDYQIELSQDPRSFLLKARGVLFVAGKEQDILLSARGFAQGGEGEVGGTQELLMTDYGIKPPSLMLGAIKTENKILIRYRLELVLEQKK